MKKDSIAIGLAVLLLAAGGFYRLAHRAAQVSAPVATESPGSDLESQMLIHKLQNVGDAGGSLEKLRKKPGYSHLVEMKILLLVDQGNLTRSETLAAALNAQIPLPAPPDRGSLRADALDRFGPDHFLREKSFGWQSQGQTLPYSNDYEVGAAMLLVQAMQEELKARPDWQRVDTLLQQGRPYLASDATPAGKCIELEYDRRAQFKPGSPDYREKLFHAYADSADWALAAHYLLRTDHPSLDSLLKFGRATGNTSVFKELIAAADPNTSPDVKLYGKILTLRMDGKLREAMTEANAAADHAFFQKDPEALRLVRNLNMAFILVTENYRAAVAAQQRLDKLGNLDADDLLKSAWLHDLHGDTEAAKKLYNAYLDHQPNNPNREAIVRNRLAGGPRPFFAHVVAENQGGDRNIVLGEGVPEAQIPPIRVFANRMRALTTSSNTELQGLRAFDGRYQRLDCHLKFRDPAEEARQHRYRFQVDFQTDGIPDMNPKPLSLEDVDAPFHSFVLVALPAQQAQDMVGEEPETWWNNTPFGSFWTHPFFGWDAPGVDRDHRGWPGSPGSAPNLTAEAVFKLFEEPVDSKDWHLGAEAPAQSSRAGNPPPARHP